MTRTTNQTTWQTVELELRAQLLAALEGDQAVYQLFLKKIGHLLHSYFQKRLSNWPQDIEDLVQETMMAIHQQRHTYKPAQPLTAWVYAIARYKLADRWRHYASHEALHEELHDELEVFAPSDIEALQVRRDLNVLLQTLPENQRLPIIHTKLQGLSVKESCQITGLSESASKVGVHRGLKALRRVV